MSFTPVDDLPQARRGKPIPPARAALIEYATSHPGVWLRYDAVGTGREPHSIATISGYVRKRAAGFERPGFEACQRRHQLFVRWLPSIT